MLSEVVEDMFFAGDNSVIDGVVQDIGAPVNVGSVVHGPGLILYFGLKITRPENMTIIADSNVKLSAIE